MLDAHRHASKLAFTGTPPTGVLITKLDTFEGGSDATAMQFDSTTPITASSCNRYVKEDA
jgi:hypothetical protein